jgi:hypothetical protein
MSTITFAGQTVWAAATNGAGWSFTPGVPVGGAVEKKAPLGEGWWVLPEGSDFVDHQLELQWRATTPAVIEALLRALPRNVTGSLVVPGHTTKTRCRLAGVGALSSFRSDAGTGYIVRTTLTFREYV